MSKRLTALQLLVLIGLLGSLLSAGGTVTARASAPPGQVSAAPDTASSDAPRLARQPADGSYFCDPDFQALVLGVADAVGFTLPARIVAWAGPSVPPAPGDPIVAFFETIPVTPKTGDGICGGMTQAVEGKLDTCMIVFRPEGQALAETYLLNAKADLDLSAAPDLFQLLAHELYHCHQFSLLDDVACFSLIPLWISEGTAEWVGMNYAYGGNSRVVESEFWPEYLDTLDRDLFTRDYDAVGFFAHFHLQVARNGTDERRFWDVLDDLVRMPWLETQGDAGVRDDLNDAAFTTLVELGGEAFLALWAMGTVREQGWGDDDAWWLIGPGLADGQRPPPPEVYVLVPDAPVTVGVDPRAILHAGIQIEPGAAVLEVTLIGYGGIHWHEEDRDDRFAGEQTYRYCVDSAGCTCPDGSSPLGDDARQIPANATATLALTGGLNAGSAQFTLRTMDSLCEGTRPDGTGAQSCSSGGDGMAVVLRGFRQENGCSCDTLLPGSEEVFSPSNPGDDFKDGTHILLCEDFYNSPPYTIALTLGYGPPQTDRYPARDDCDPVNLPQSGLPACVLEDPAVGYVTVWVLVDDSTLFYVDVLSLDGITPGQRQIAIDRADHAAVVILGG